MQLAMAAKKDAKKSNWVRRQRRDAYVNAARTAGFRSRAVFKLSEIDNQYGLIKPNLNIVDLGAAPGGWSQYIAPRLGRRGQLIAVDLLPMQPINKVQFVHGDFTDESIITKIAEMLDVRGADLVLSDMAPNLSGIAVVDQARATKLHLAVLEFCQDKLRAGGSLLIKLFAGESAPSIALQLDKMFGKTRTIKPPASRAKSKEFYMIGQNFWGATPRPNRLYCEYA